MKKGQIEALLRNKFINIVKKYVGKGPQEVTIKIVKNFIVFEYIDILTPYEKHLLNVENGPQQVEDLRTSIAQVSHVDYTSIIEDLFDVEIVDFATKINLVKDMRIGLIAVSENIEEKIEKGFFINREIV